MRISDLSSDVAKADLKVAEPALDPPPPASDADHPHTALGERVERADPRSDQIAVGGNDRLDPLARPGRAVDRVETIDAALDQHAVPRFAIGRASWRARGCQYV